MSLIADERLQFTILLLWIIAVNDTVRECCSFLE